MFPRERQLAHEEAVRESQSWVFGAFAELDEGTTCRKPFHIPSLWKWYKTIITIERQEFLSIHLSPFHYQKSCLAAVDVPWCSPCFILGWLRSDLMCEITAVSRLIFPLVGVPCPFVHVLLLHVDFWHKLLLTCGTYITLFIYNITARPWGLPGLAIEPLLKNLQWI